MSESTDLPNLPGYVSIKEAAKKLGLSDKTVYSYVVNGRIPAYQAADVILVSIEEIEKFERNPSGRPRKNTPSWRIASGDNTQLATQIFVQIRSGQENALKQKLERIRKSGQHIFPGTAT